MNEEALEEMFAEFTTGVYYGWAQVGQVDQTVYPMVMSLGWNPYYNNEKRSAVSSEFIYMRDVINNYIYRRYIFFTNLSQISMMNQLESL